MEGVFYYHTQKRIRLESNWGLLPVQHFRIIKLKDNAPYMPLIWTVLADNKCYAIIQYSVSIVGKYMPVSIL